MSRRNDIQQARPCRVLITGSRTWEDKGAVREALATVWSPGSVLISGACRTGADALCESCWTSWGGRVERFPAAWDRDGRSAGPRRNARMVGEARADVCLAFIRDSSRGASHTAELAEKAGIPTYRITDSRGQLAMRIPGVEHQRTVSVPITQLPHLADAACRRGGTDRVIRVDAPSSQQVKTPGRRPGQWLGSGAPLKTIRPQYLSPPEIEAIECGEIAAIWEGGFER